MMLTADIVISNLESHSFSSIARGISQLHSAYHALEYREIFPHGNESDPKMEKGFEKSVMAGEYDSLLIRLVSHPNHAISFESGHLLDHSPTGLDSLCDFWDLRPDEVQQLLHEQEHRAGAVHYLQKIIFECQPEAARTLELWLPKHQELPGALNELPISVLSSRAKQLQSTIPEISADEFLFASELTARLNRVESVSVARFTGEALQLFLDIVSPENSKVPSALKSSLSTESAAKAFRQLPQIAAVLFGVESGAEAHDYIKNFFETVKASRASAKNE